MKFLKKSVTSHFLKQYVRGEDSNKPLHLEVADLHKGYTILEKSLEKIKNRYHFENPLVVIGPNTSKIKYHRKNLVNKLDDILTEMNCESVNKVIYDENPLTVDGVRKFYAEKIKQEDIKFDMCIGVGGGRVIDAAKIIANPNHSVTVIPTSLSNDGFASPTVSVVEKNPNGDTKNSYFFSPPIACIGEYSILLNSPQIRKGYGDFVSKYTSTFDWKLWSESEKNSENFSDLAYEMLHFASEALMLTVTSMPTEKKIITLNPRYLDFLFAVGIGSAAAIISAGSTIPASGSEHKICHCLDLESLAQESTHAEKCGLATVPMAYLQGQDWKLVRETLSKVGLPVSFEEMGVSKKEMKQVIKNARRFRPERYCVLQEVRDNTVLKAFEKTEVF